MGKPSDRSAGSSTELEPKPQSSLVQNARAFASGGVGGVCAVLTGHPFDLVKVNMQTAEKGMYTGAIDVVRKITAKRGPMGYDLGKNLVRSFSPATNSKDGFTTSQIAMAGFFSAVPTTIITAPMERVKVLLQIQGQTLKAGETAKYSGTMDCARQLLKQGGMASLYRGTVMTLARDGPGSAAYFATYEIIKKKLTVDKGSGEAGGKSPSLAAIMLAGAAAGVAMWIPVFPVDTVKSRLQSMPGRPRLADVVRDLYARGGFKAFFPGFAPAIARAVPANAATFLGVELAQSVMSSLFDREEV